MSESNLTLEYRGQIAVITLHRAPVNALSQAFVREIGAAVESAGQSEARALILTGTGKFFVAGADIKEMAGFTALEAARFARDGQRTLAALERLPIPTLAAVNGFALGGGCELAMCCDMILADARAKLGQPEVTLGVIPGFGGTQRLARLVGPQRARELCYTGRMISAQEAADMGLALEVTEGPVLERAMELAGSIVANSPCAVGWVKESIREGYDLPLESALDQEAQRFGLCFATQDQDEGMAAFLEKRDPQFPGC